jgi:hypothetical protein
MQPSENTKRKGKGKGKGKGKEVLKKVTSKNVSYVYSVK